MNSEITTESEQQVNSQPTTLTAPRTATTVAAQPHQTVQDTAPNIQYHQHPVQQSPTTGQSAVSNPTQGMIARTKAITFMNKVDDGIKKVRLGQRALYEMEYRAATPLIIEYERTDPTDLPRKELDKALKAAMDKAEINFQANTPGCLMIAKLMCGENCDRAKKISHYGLVAYKLGFQPTDESIETFRKKYGPPQTVWQTLDKNGKPKTTATSNAAVPGKNSDPKLPRKDLIKRGELAVAKKALYKAVPHALKDQIKPPAKKQTVVVLAEIDPDLGFQINAVIEDDKLLNDAYMTYGKKYVTANEHMANQLEKLAEKPLLRINSIREEAGEEIANECKTRWEAEKDTTDFYKDVPEGLKKYDELVQEGEVANLRSKDEGEKIYKDAVLHLEQQKQMGVNVEKHLDSRFDPNIHVDIMHMPRLLAYISLRNQDKQNDIKQQAVFASVLKEVAAKLRAKHQPS
jgi:hypothetical protein